MPDNPLPPGSTIGILGGGQLGRMLAMAARHGLGPQELRGHNQDIAGMVESCRSCESLGACRAFLADPGDDPARAVFCPNHATYEALRAARD